MMDVGILCKDPRLGISTEKGRVTNSGPGGWCGASAGNDQLGLPAL